MITTERAPFLDISEADVRVGPVSGFYPMPDGKLWATRTIQQYDAMSLGEVVRRNLHPRKPDIELDLARGAFAVAGSAVYYNGAPVVFGMQTEQYVDDSVEGRKKRPRIVTMPDWDYLNAELVERKIEDPLMLVRDDLADHRRAFQLVKKKVLQNMNIDPANIHTAALYVKEAELDDLEEGETCADDIATIDSYVRRTPGVWIDHQSQASRADLIQRQQDIAPYRREMQVAAYFFEQFLVPDPELMERVVARSAVGNNGDRT